MYTATQALASPSEAPYKALVVLKGLRRWNGVDSVKIIICTPWSLDLRKLPPKLTYAGDDCIVKSYADDECMMNPGENMRPVCMTRYPFYPRAQKSPSPFNRQSGNLEDVVRKKFLKSQAQARAVDPSALQLVLEIQCVAARLGEILACVDKVIKSYGMQLAQTISLRCRRPVAWRWSRLVECVEAWKSYVYAPLRCVHSYSAVDIVIHDEELHTMTQRFMFSVLCFQSMFPNTVTLCILKFCAGPWFPRVPIVDALIAYTAFIDSQAWREHYCYFFGKGLLDPEWLGSPTGAYYRKDIDLYPKSVFRKILRGEAMCLHCLPIWFGWTCPHCSLTIT